LDSAPLFSLVGFIVSAVTDSGAEEVEPVKEVLLKEFKQKTISTERGNERLRALIQRFGIAMTAYSIFC
jgi:hypothetical protein